jgi:hypothetical protein
MHRKLVRSGAVVTAVGVVVTVGNIVWAAVTLPNDGSLTVASLGSGVAISFLGVAIGLWGLARDEPT